MKRWLLPFAVLAILGLVACPPEGNDDDDDSTTDAGPADASGCNRPNGGSRSVQCTTDDDCRCGLSCLKMQGMTQGICMERCVGDTDCAAPTPVCGVGSIVDVHRDYEVPTFTENMCVGEIGMYADCFNALSRCEQDLECYASINDDNDENDIPDAFRCLELCDISGGTPCSDANQTCVATNAGYVQLQLSDPNVETSYVACVDANCPGSSCACGSSYDCLEFSVGFYCARPQGFCGTASQPVTYEVWAGRSIPGEYICDTADGTGCDITMGGLENPPEVFCFTGIFGEAYPETGVCFGICSVPRDGANETVGDCPAEMECITGVDGYPGAYYVNDDLVACSADADCNALPNGACYELSDPTAVAGGKACFYPYGMCGAPLPVEDGGVVTDAAMTDSTVADAGTPEDASTVVDAATPDTFTPDTFTPDTFTPDTFTPDTFTPDTATVEDSAVLEDSAVVEDASSEDIN